MEVFFKHSRKDPYESRFETNQFNNYSISHILVSPTPLLFLLSPKQSCPPSVPLHAITQSRHLSTSPHHWPSSLLCDPQCIPPVLKALSQHYSSHSHYYYLCKNPPIQRFFNNIPRLLPLYTFQRFLINPMHL